MSHPNGLLEWLDRISLPSAQRAERAQPASEGADPSGSACLAGSARPVAELAARLGSDALDHYFERLAIADDLGLDTSIGTLAETIARREAERVAACLAASVWPCTRDRAVADAVVEAFRGVGGVRYIGHLPEVGTGGEP